MNFEPITPEAMQDNPSAQYSPRNPRYPDCTLVSSSLDGNAFGIMSEVSKALKRHLIEVEDMSYEEASAICEDYRKEAKSGDYSHLVYVSQSWISFE